MPSLSRFVTAIAIGVFLAVPGETLAADDSPRSLRVPTIAASVAAAADWATTYHALKFYQVREVNPLLRGMDHRPAAMVTTGALIDAGLISGWNMTVGRQHPRAAAAGLWVMTVFRASLAVHNLRNEARAARRTSN